MSSMFTTLQKLAPQHALSRLAGRVASSESRRLKSLLIEQFAKVYNVNLDEAERKDFNQYHSFNDFFTRSLEPGARPLADAADTLVCPADGAISQAGKIEGGQLIQAKGHTYSLTSLAGSLGEGLSDGDFCTIYLAPRDYHRVHLPFDGTLTATLAIPGALFSVNANTEANIVGLFARNERLVCRFETHFGPMLVILVGAMIVASIATDWEGPHSPYQHEDLSHYHLVYERGDEIGRFLLGSTVICCFPPGAVALGKDIRAGLSVKMGQALGQVRATP
jgi:phosphatidylserine decarboxylase